MGRFRVLLGAIAVTLALVGTSCEPTPAPAPPSPDPARALVVAGLGAWWDVFDWSPTFVRSLNPTATPPLGLADVDRLAADGVQTLFIQTATFRHPSDLLDATLLRRIVTRAHQHDMKVIGWYLPQFVDLEQDLDRLIAAAKFGFDGVGVDIESTENPDVADRTESLLVQSRFLRGAFPTLPLIAIPVTPIVWEELNRTWWPRFPYRQLVQYYDAWAPMAYWSFRSPESGWRDPYRYTYETVVRLRRLTGRSDLRVHPIGGLAEGMTTKDVFWMNAAMTDSGAIGGSIYDDVTTADGLWGALGLFRRDLVK